MIGISLESMDALFGIVPHDEEKLRNGQLGAAVAVKRLDDDDEDRRSNNDDKTQTTAQVERV